MQPSSELTKAGSQTMVRVSVPLLTLEYNVMSYLSRSQKIALGSFVTLIVMMFITFFLEGNVKTFGYIVASVAFAGFIIILSGNEEKDKRS
jgi:hypothetical protein